MDWHRSLNSQVNFHPRIAFSNWFFQLHNTFMFYLIELAYAEVSEMK